MSDAETLQYAIAAYGGLALAAGMICVWLRKQFPGGRSPLLPLQRQWRGDWTGFEVLLTFAIVILAPGLCFSILLSLDFYSRFYHETPSTEQQQLWAVFLACPIIVAAVITALHLGSGTRPADLGLSPVRIVPNTCLGYLGFLLLSPVVWAINVLAVQFMAPRGHPFERMLENALPAEWALVFFEAMLAAPIYEELVFRGVLQGWLKRAPRRGHVVLASAAVLLPHLGWIPYLSDETGNVPCPDWEPSVFVAMLVAAYGVIVQRSYAQTGGSGDALTGRPMSRPLPAIFGASVLFAVFHGSAWPAPVPLFFLSLGFGWLADRSHNLIGPILAHAAFNGISCVALLARALTG